MKTKFAYSGVIAFIVLAVLAAPAHAEINVCAGTNIAVNGDDAIDMQGVCLGVRDAIGFLDGNGLDTNIPLLINLVPHIPECKIKNVFGYFDKKLGKAYILPYWVCCSDTDTMKLFGLPMDRVLYRSLVTHEVAHAIINHNFSTQHPAWIAHEYIAYVAQVAMLPQEYRGRAMALYPGTGFEVETQINATSLMMAPNKFALQSYRHYQKQENGKAFLHRLLSGKVKPWHGLEYP